MRRSAAPSRRAERVARADLTALGMPGSRRAALKALAEAAIADPLLFQPCGTVDEAIARLRSIRGIGEWTAQYIALRAMREPDAFPAGDVGLLRAPPARPARARRRACCSSARSPGVRGAPMPPSTCGPPTQPHAERESMPLQPYNLTTP